MDDLALAMEISAMLIIPAVTELIKGLDLKGHFAFVAYAAFV